MIKRVAIGRSGVAALLASAVIFLPAALSGQWVRPALLDANEFPVPASLEPNVAFWTTVYSTYTTEQSLFHDDLYLDIVYEVLDFSSHANLSDTRKRLLRRQGIRDAEARWGKILRNLAAGKTDPAQAEVYARVEAMFAGKPGGRAKYIEAIDRFRSQRCLRDEFARGIERSGRYLPGIETIFARRGLPKALTLLPFVESMFHLGARSSAAAAGAWQFMPSTARMYLRMDLEVDERYDPWRAADGAASHLLGSYKRVRAWPVAVTAYNHGPAGMARAVRQLGTNDIGEIVKRYRSRTFGFASRNFYSEFIAAVTVYEERDQRFPGVTPHPPLRHELYTPDVYLDAGALAAGAGFSTDDLRALNPGFDRRIWSGDLLLPKDYAMRVPAGFGDRMDTVVASLDARHRSPHQKGRTYRVKRGDTLAKIAGRFGSSVAAIKRANKLRSAHLIRVGQVLRIPSPGSSRVAARRAPPPAITTSQVPASNAPTTKVAKARKPGTYKVRAGDTLSSIASSHGTTVRAIQRTNRLRSAHRIAVGQRLTIPDGDTVSHVVRRGDTLSTIAARYGTTVGAITRHNALRSTTIRPRQVLVIP